MRDIGSDLLDAIKGEQTIGGKTGKRIPYVELVFHNKEDTETLDYSDRCTGGQQYEGLQSGSATILLNNDDHQVEWIKGWWIDMVFGDYFFDDDGDKTGYEAYPIQRMWVKSQTDISSPGVKTIALELEGVWEKLDESPCLVEENILAPYHYYRFAGFTPFWMIGYFLQTAGFGLHVLEEDDGIMDSLVSTGFEINKPPEEANGVYESFKDSIFNALSYTKSYLRIRHGMGGVEFYVFYNEDVKGDREADETYYSYQGPWFEEKAYRENIVIPNKVLTYCNYNWELNMFNDLPIIGFAEDQDSIDAYGNALDIEWFPGIDSQEFADAVAEATLERAKIAARGGRLIIPMDHRVEIGDVVEVYDAR